MEKRKHISNELKEWIINTLQSGVKPEAIVDGMIKKGFDTRFANTTLFGLIEYRPVKTTASANEPYHYELPKIGEQGNLLQIDGREVIVLSRMDKPFILHLDNVLSREECAQLINLARDRLEVSTVIDP